MEIRTITALLMTWTQCFGAFGVPIPGASYYVNQETGSDSNPGSFASPFLTVGRCNTAISATANAGCAIYGGTSAQSLFRESFSCSANGQYAIGYGNFQPRITGLALVAGGAWSNYSGSVYQFSASTDTISSGNGWINQVENGVGLTMAASLASLTSPGYFVPSNGSMSGTSFPVYVYATGGGNPASNGKTYEYTARNMPLSCEGYSGVHLSNIQADWNLTNDGSVGTGPYALKSNLTILHGTKHNDYDGPGITLQSSTITDAYYGGQPSTFIVYNADTGGGEPLNYSNNTISSSGAYCGSCQCIYGHVNIGGTFGALTENGITCSNMQGGVTNLSTTSTAVTNFTMTGCQTAIELYANATITNPNINCGTTGNAINVGAGSSGLMVNLSGGTVEGATANQAPVYFFGEPVNLTISGTTVINPTSGYGVWANAAGSTLTQSGVTFTGANAYIALSPGLTSNNNVLSGEPNINAAFYTRAQVCSTFGQECNSTP